MAGFQEAENPFVPLPDYVNAARSALAPISELEATRRLEVADFEQVPYVSVEAIDTTAPVPELGTPDPELGAPAPAPAVCDDNSLGCVSVPTVFGPAGSYSAQFMLGGESWDVLKETVKVQGDLIAKLQEQIDSLNGRVNSIEARIAKYNLGASHKL